jgi:hypothetical protein
MDLAFAPGVRSGFEATIPVRPLKFESIRMVPPALITLSTDDKKTLMIHSIPFGLYRHYDSQL